LKQLKFLLANRQESRRIGAPVIAMATTTSTTFTESSSNFELRDRSLDPLPNSESAPVSAPDSQNGDLIAHIDDPEFSLPPVDGGKDAWLFLAGAFMIEALVWGMCLVLDPVELRLRSNVHQVSHSHLVSFSPTTPAIPNSPANPASLSSELSNPE
jgi:hypothetical protein